MTFRIKPSRVTTWKHAALAQTLNCSRHTYRNEAIKRRSREATRPPPSFGADDRIPIASQSKKAEDEVRSSRWSAVLCCVVLCCAVLCCAVLCCVALRCVVLCCVVLCCAVLCCVALRCVVLCCVVLCCVSRSKQWRAVLSPLLQLGRRTDRRRRDHIFDQVANLHSTRPLPPNDATGGRQREGAGSGVQDFDFGRGLGF
jgi:hypothetical protein